MHYNLQMSSTPRCGPGVVIGMLVIAACANAPIKTEPPVPQQPRAATFRSTAELVKDPVLAAKVERLAAKDEIQTAHVGHMIPSKTYALFEEIAGASSRQQLLALLLHQSPVVRGYTLMEVKDAFAEDVEALGPLLGDATRVKFLFADQEAEYRICELTFNALPFEALTKLRTALVPVAAKVGVGCWEFALRGLAILRDSNVATIAEPLLGRADPAIVRPAIDALQLADVKTSAAPIRALTSSPQAMIRADAARALGHFRSAESEVILRRLLEDPDEQVRACALESYARQAGRDLGLLQTALKSANDLARLHVDLGLVKDARPDSLALLRQRLEARQESSMFWHLLERELAARALRLDTLKGVLRFFQDSSAHDPASRVSKVLFEACDKECLPSFRERLQHGSETEQRQAAYAVGRLKDRQSIPRLRSLLQAAEPSLRVAAARALLKLKVRDAIADVEKAAQLPAESYELESLQAVLRDLRKLPLSGS